jgi:hypothetical protein
LNRGSGEKQLTRIQYALRKQNHALGISESADALHQPNPCKFLADELARTQKDSDLKAQLIQASASGLAGNE